MYDGIYIVIGQFRGNRVMTQKNRMMEQRITDSNQAIEEKNVLRCIKLYTLVYLVQVVYTSGFT